MSPGGSGSRLAIKHILLNAICMVFLGFARLIVLNVELSLDIVEKVVLILHVPNLCKCHIVCKL
jgi:hypothetical protein